MGTRHLTLVQQGQQIKVAQYGQWDGYPAGQGEKVLNFLRTADMNKFKTQLLKTYFVNEGSPMLKEIDKVFEKFNKKYQKLTKEKNWDDISNRAASLLSKKDEFLYRLFTRDTGAKILQLIYDATGIKDATGAKRIPLNDSSNFAGDSLFCEWAYLINLDENTLEVYRGFNQKPLEIGDRFYGAPLECAGYCPIRLLKTYKLNRLPKLENFVKELKRLANKRDKERKTK